MPADRLLGTLLRSLQTYTDQQDTPRLLGTASSLLTTLHNPLNVTLLTSQLLSAPAIWARPEGLRTCMQCMSVFHSAAQALIKHEAAQKDKKPDQDHSKPQLEHTLPRNDWIKAAVNGADEHSPRWRHLLVIAGLLLGFGPREDHHLSRNMRQTLERALTTAANFALGEPLDGDELAQETVALVFNHCFPLLGNYERARIEYATLLPVLMRAAFHASDGLRSAYFLGAVDQDVSQATGATKLQWHDHSPSFQLVEHMRSGPLIASLGPLSNLIGHTVEQVQDHTLVTAVLDDLENFARTLHTQWRQNKISHFDDSQLGEAVDDPTLKLTLPVLWRLLQSVLFASVIILKSVLGRTLGDGSLARHSVAPLIADQTLSILRHLYFISARQGGSSFSQYNFVHYTALDILGAYPSQVQGFLMNIKPSQLGTVPEHALDRNLDLFFLNTAEHFYLLLPPQVGEQLIVPAVTAYLSAGAKDHLLPLFEAAHSVTLAMFSAPQNTAGTIRHLPFYVDSLFRAFPKHLSARQFRMAFKSLLKIASPPSPLALSEPTMPAVLLELLHHRAKTASRAPVPVAPGSAEAAMEAPVVLSEQAIIALTILDTLTEIPLTLLDEWLPIVAETINSIDDDTMRDHCRDQFWQVLVGGDMDPERSRVCHAWWSTAGGRDLLLYSPAPDDEGDEAMMSGALPNEKLSKL